MILALTTFAGANGRIGGVSSDTVHLFDLAGGKDNVFALPGAAFVAFDGKGKLLAATHHEVYMEDDKGGLAPLVDLSDTDVHGLAGSASGVWVAMGTELGLLAEGKFNASSGAALPKGREDHVPSSSGDVWALSAGALSRYSATPAGDETLWSQTVLPVFYAGCAARVTCPAGRPTPILSYYGCLGGEATARLSAGDRQDADPDAAPPPLRRCSRPTTITAIQNWIKSGTMPAGG